MAYHPRYALKDSVSEVARQLGVSRPTLRRFRARMTQGDV
ncbi:helix-turn-helix domain-containing protein [Sphingobium xenophagum]|nr:hypothetical protein DM480_17785 [Sphingomonas sp. FARSPH]MBP7637586.1 helix-turn-helix domain-containing protein [Kiritimatiellia bacterium]MBS0503383.1 helix-turn-helix domain-containing protein [Pseudomonadota bacterium]